MNQPFEVAEDKKVRVAGAVIAARPTACIALACDEGEEKLAAALASVNLPLRFQLP